MAGTEEYDPGQGRQHFERPETLLNRTLRWVADHRTHAELPQAQIDALRDDSMGVFSGIVADQEALERVRSATRWYMADVSCPSMVLSGEVTVDDDGDNPEVRFFEDAPVLTIGSDRRREARLLGAADHFTGHLYSYFTGAVDYDEHAAAYWQNRAAVARADAGDGRFRFTPFLNMLGYRQHKKIPLGVYSPRSWPLTGQLREDIPSVEVCKLRYPSVAGWTRVSTDSAEHGALTQYTRPVPAIDGTEMPTFPMIAGGDGEEVWEAGMSGPNPGGLNQLDLTKEGRPASHDIDVVAGIEAGLREIGVPPIEVQPPEVGGFPQVMGY